MLTHVAAVNTCKSEGSIRKENGESEYRRSKNSDRNLSLVVRNLVFGVSDHVSHKPGCAATEDG